MNPKGCCFLIALAGIIFLACALSLPISENPCVEKALERSPSLKSYSHLPPPQVTLEGKRITWPKETGVLIWYFLAKTGETVRMEVLPSNGTEQKFRLGMYDQDLCLVIYNQVELTAVSKPLIVMIPGNN